MSADVSNDGGLATPAWAAAYRHASVRMATLQTSRSAPSRLVFASVDLLVPGRPAAQSGRVERRKLAPMAAELFFRRVAMSAPDALAWAWAALCGRCVTPTPAEPHLRDVKFDGLPIEVRPLTVEPPWPELGLALGEAQYLQSDLPPNTPFAGSGARPARLSRLVAAPDPALETLAGQDEAVRWMENRLHFDLALYPEYRGSLVVIAPDPVLQAADMFMLPSGQAQGAGEGLILQLTPRPGASLGGLKVSVVEMRFGSLTRHEDLEVPPHGVIQLERAGGWDRVGFVITHPVHGVLRYQPPTPFVRGFRIDMRLRSRDARVMAPLTDSPNAPEAPYEASETVEAGPVRVSGENDAAALSGFYAASERRRRLAAATESGQRWLHDRAEAQTFLRGLIGKAGQRVWVADPYLGGRQIFQFLHAVTRLDVQIRLLTSRLAFQGEGDEDAAATSAEAEKLAVFRQGLATLDKRGLPDVDARVLAGKTPALHDRFVVIDDQVWFSGNSLNALGDRASMILKLPNPEEPIERLGAMLDRAEPFKAFIARRSQAAGSDG